MPILFSIIIPTYNRAHLIQNTIASVVKQECKNFELIIVDDGSTDDTEHVIKQILQLNNPTNIFYYYKTNGERGAARNYGLQKATGDYVIYFDSDDEYYPNHLSEAAKFIDSKPRVEMFHLRYDIKSSERVKISEGPVITTLANGALIKGNFLSCNGVVIRRDVALANPFNEDRELSAAEDWELWLRLSVQYDIHYVNTITSTIFNHQNRSVLVTQKDKLIVRIERLMKYVIENESITAKHRNNLNIFRSSCYSYIALHLALTHTYRATTLKYLFKSTLLHPAFIFQKRFFAILKNLL